MRVVTGLGLAAALAFGGAASAQVALDPATPMILNWTPQQQSDWYRSIETVFRTTTVKAGRKVHALPNAATTIAPAWEHDGKSWTVDSYMAAYNVSGILVLKDGKVVLEKYGLGRKPEDRWTSFSVAKSVTSTLVGAAIQDGKIESLASPVTDYIPELKGTGYDGVTVRQLLMMSSGVKWNEDYTDPKSDVAQAGSPAYAEPGINPMVSYMRRLPRENAPGSNFNYNTGETDMVGVLVSRATGKSLSAYASEKLWKPYGMERDAVWMTDLGGQERGGCCLSVTLRDYGRIGQFILDGGKAGKKQVLPAGWTAEATTPQITSGTRERGYGYFWWMPDSGAYEARGIFGQSITTFRDERIIIVTNAAWPRATGRDLSAARNAFIKAAYDAAMAKAAN